MSTFVLAILTGAKTKIKNFETVNTSSPSFLNVMKSLRLNLKSKIILFKFHVMVVLLLEKQLLQK